MRRQTSAWNGRTALIGAVALAALSLAAAACGSSTSSSDKTATAAAGRPAGTNTQAAVASPVTTKAATTPAAGSTSSATAGATGAAKVNAMAVPASGLKDVDGAALTHYLTDGAGMTLYIFKNDVANSGASTVPAAILPNWPPLTTTGAATAGTGVTGTLGTMAGPDGKTWVTYKGKPLYHFKGDAAAGDTKGEAVGGIWYVTGP